MMTSLLLLHPQSAQAVQLTLPIRHEVERVPSHMAHLLLRDVLQRMLEEAGVVVAGDRHRLAWQYRMNRKTHHDIKERRAQSYHVACTLQ